MIKTFKNFDEAEYGIPFMIKKGRVVSPEIYIKTTIGVLGADVESEKDVGYNSVNIFFIPNGGNGDICDLASCRVETNNSDKLKCLFFGSIYKEDPTETVLWDKSQINEAFMIGDVEK